MTWKQAAVIAIAFGVIAAGIVWFLEDFNRQRMSAEWRSFIEDWARGGQPAGGQ
jgi:hypothetical protein